MGITHEHFYMMGAKRSYAVTPIARTHRTRISTLNGGCVARKIDLIPFYWETPSNAHRDKKTPPSIGTDQCSMGKSLRYVRKHWEFLYGERK